MGINARKYLEKKYGKLTLGKTIQAIRLCDEISQTEFARKLKVSSQYLCDLEHDRKDISAKKAKEFADILDYPPEVFVALAIQDSLDRAGIRMKVEIKAA